MKVIVGQSPEQCAVAGKKQRACQQQTQQRNTPRHQHVPRYHERHHQRTGNVRVSKLLRLEARQKQGCARHSTDLVSGHYEE